MKKRHGRPPKPKPTAKRRKKKPSIPWLHMTAGELNRAIAAVTSHRARIEATIDDLQVATNRLQVAARHHEETVQKLRQRGVLDSEVEKAIAKLRVTFRDGPVLINETLIQLARDILQEHIRDVLHDQMNDLVKELCLIVREEVQAEVSAAVRDIVDPDPKD